MREPSAIEVPAHIKAIAPYLAGKPIDELAREHGLDPASIVKLASNENPRGMPESARRAVREAVADLGRYPDSNGFALKSALSAKLNIPIDCITLGNGSNDILELAAAAFLTADRSCVYAQHSFVVYALATQARGARAIVAPAKDLGHDLDAMLGSIADDTALIYIANPNNPTGTYLSSRLVESFLQQVRETVVVVIDEAYNEYLPPAMRFDSVRWIDRFANLLISRTFSKAFGLAGLRVGYGLAQPQLTGALNRVRQPFNVNVAAQAAAVAALSDDVFVEESYQLNRAGMGQLTDAFGELGLKYVPSLGNFILVKVGDARRVFQELLTRGVIVRPVANYALPEWLRITVGLPDENERLVEALREALAAASP